MNSTLRNKAIFVLAIILVCVYGIIGLPKSKDELLKNWNDNIRLGLDLKGGSQLVLQVQAQDAFKAEADQTIERLKVEMQKDGVSYVALIATIRSAWKTPTRLKFSSKESPLTRSPLSVKWLTPVSQPGI